MDFKLPEENSPTTIGGVFTTIKNFVTTGSAKGGACPVNCQREFFIFLAVMCFIKFAGATGRASESQRRNS